MPSVLKAPPPSSVSTFRRCVPGSAGAVSNVDEVKKLGAKIGFPVLIKAVAGGGGRGMKVIENVDQAEEAFNLAQSEARSAFGSRLSALGITVFPSQANFVLARFPGGAEAAAAAQSWLEVRGVLPRRLAARDFADCIRFTIGTSAEMVRTAELLEARRP